MAAGSTPFVYASQPRVTLPGSNYYLNGAAQTSFDVLRLVTILAYYAVYEKYPTGFASKPNPVPASNVCLPWETMDFIQYCPCI